MADDFEVTDDAKHVPAEVVERIKDALKKTLQEELAKESKTLGETEFGGHLRWGVTPPKSEDINK
jgi:hypothetical protein